VLNYRQGTFTSSLAGWCVAGLRRDRAQAEEPPLSLAAGLGLCLATDAGVALTSLLR